jgi:hypothetical protein
VSQPTNEELCAKVGDGMRGSWGVRSLYFSTERLTTQTDTNVFQLSQPRTFAYPLAEALRYGARALLAQPVKAEVTALSRDA